MAQQLIDVKASIQDRLIMVALRLFAQQGVEAVSLRTINSEAGSKNKSAVQYHFGSKLGILEAIFEKIGERLLPIYDDLFTRLNKLSRKRRLYSNV